VRTPEKWPLVAAVVAVAIVAATQAMIAAVYHGLYDRNDIYLGGLGFVLFMTGFGVALAAVGKWRHGLLKLFLSAFFFYNAYTLMRGHVFGGPLSGWVRAALAMGFAALFLFLHIRVGAEGWRKLAKAIIVACGIFAATPLCMAWVIPSSPVPVAQQGIFSRGDIHNLLVVILDETSPEYASGFVQDLTQAHLHVASADVAAAGNNTLNAIPSMLSGTRHDDVAPCTATALCGAQNFQFAALNASWKKTDIVGFYHPYCAIGGLRSCHRQENGSTDSSSVNFGLYMLWCGQFNRGGLLPFCDRGAPYAAAAARTKKSMIARIDHSPFWRDGGLMVVHYPLPHPSMIRSAVPLRAEYESNIAEARFMVSRLTERLTSSFASDFTLVITSDHALRTAMWCASPEYAKAGCADGLPPDHGLVPFIVASPKPISVAIPTSNVGLLAPFFTQ
jgi:hypothetical protein